MVIYPCRLDDANLFIIQYHRHHGTVQGCKFCLSISDDEKVRGVVVVGRPVARMLDDGLTLEVTRCCTDGVKNGCSMLYSAAWRATRALGYKKLVTYTLNDESGVSLSAAGWKKIGECGGGSWGRKDRPRIDKHPLQKKIKWEIS
jgi:hypothetical protein